MLRNVGEGDVAPSEMIYLQARRCGFDWLPNQAAGRYHSQTRQGARAPVTGRQVIVVDLPELHVEFPAQAMLATQRARGGRCSGVGQPQI